MNFLHLKFQSLCSGFSGDSSLRVSHASIPTYGSIVGILAASKGISREDKQGLETIKKEIKFLGMIDQNHTKNNVYLDYQIVSKNSNYIIKKKGKSSKCENLIRQKEYIFDSHYDIFIGMDKDVSDYEESIQKPFYPIYFGKKVCFPSCRIYQEKICDINIFDVMESYSSENTVSYFSEKPPKYDNQFFVKDFPIYFKSATNYMSRIVYYKEGK